MEDLTSAANIFSISYGIWYAQFVERVTLVHEKHRHRYICAADVSPVNKNDALL